MARDDAPPLLFALEASASLGAAVGTALGCDVAAHEERSFDDGEHKARPLAPVLDRDVYVLQGLHAGPVQGAAEKLCRLLFFIGALRDAGAARITALVPYLCYSRKDRRTNPRDPVTTRYVAAMFESVGTDTVVSLDVHNPAAFENAFRRRTVALTATPIFVERLRGHTGTPLCVVSPDTGGAKRAELFRRALEEATATRVGMAFAEKHRRGGVVSGELFVGEVAGATALLVDDLVSTGTTLLRAARAARAAGAVAVLAVVTHGLFMKGACAALADPAIDRILCTDTVPPFRLTGTAARAKLEVVSAVPLLAEAVARLHGGRPLDDLLVN